MLSPASLDAEQFFDFGEQDLGGLLRNVCEALLPLPLCALASDGDESHHEHVHLTLREASIMDQRWWVRGARYFPNTLLQETEILGDFFFETITEYFELYKIMSGWLYAPLGRPGFLA